VTFEWLPWNGNLDLLGERDPRDGLVCTSYEVECDFIIDMLE